MRKEELFVARGNMLWEGSRMMLPEHKEAWIEMQERENDVPLHEELADDEWQELGTTVINALKHAHEVIVNYWHDGRYYELVCTIDKLDQLNKRIKVVFSNDYEWLNLRVIKNITLP